MPIFSKPNATLYAKKQTDKGAAAALSGANAVDFRRDSPLIWPKGEMIDRGLNRAGRFPSAKFIAGQWGEGGVNHELRGSGTAGTPPSGLSPFLETLFGSELTNTAGTVEAGSGAVGGFDSTLSLTVGQLVRVEIGGGHEVRRIAGKTGAGPVYSYTVQRNFSQAPADAAVISAGVTYCHMGTETETFMTLEQYVGTVRHTFTDAVCEQLQLTIAERQLLIATLAVRSLTYAKAIATPDPYTEAFDDTQPHAATLMNLVKGGSLLDMKSCEFTLGTRRARGGINSAGYGDLPWKSVFEATGKIAPWVEDFAAFDDFFAGTLATLEATKGTAAGNIVHLEIGGIQYTGPEVGEEEDDFIWDLPFEVTGGVWLGLF